MIKIHNDGKGKYMSWEARLECDSSVVEGSPAFASFYFRGYGETEQEAVEDLKRLVGAIVENLKAWDYDERIEVAWDGTPLEEYLKKHGPGR